MLVRFSLNEPVHYFREILAGHAQLAGAATTANRKQDVGCSEFRRSSFDKKVTVETVDGIDFLSGENVELKPSDNVLPDTEKCLFRNFGELQLAIQRQFDGLCQHKLLPRIVQYGAAHFFLLEHRIAEVLCLRRKRRGKTGRACTDDQHIQIVKLFGTMRRSNMLDCLETLRHSVLDESHSTKFADDVQPLDVGLVVVIVMRNLHSLPRSAKPK